MGVAVSIIVPVYNVEKFISKCLDSILVQTFSDFECILVNDSSLTICNKYAQNDNRIKIIHNQNNIGSSLTRKIGLDNSSGEYIMFVDADDYIENDMLEKMYSKLMSKNYDMVYCDFYRHYKSNSIEYHKVPILSDNFVSNIKNAILGADTGRVLWNKLYKKKLFDVIEFPKDGQSEDQYIFTQIIYFSKNNGYLNTALYHHQYNKYSMAHNPSQYLDRYIGSRNNFVNIVSFIKKNYNDDLSVFEPELSKRADNIENMKLITPKKIIKGILRVIIPIKTWRKYLRKLYNNIENVVKADTAHSDTRFKKLFPNL
jgi:glycosyltransferase involved in cell wall biosynthesis